MRHWALVVADWSREYPNRDLATESFPGFMWHLQGLSKHSRFMAAWHDAPKNLYNPADIAAVTAAARR